MCLSQAQYQPFSTYLRDVQADGMTEAWRLKMMTWFNQLAETCSLSEETLSVATNYLDRYLSAESCCSQRFQLASVAAIFLASKVEEARPFRTTDFEKLSDGAFTPVHVRFMELELLCALKWRLHPPTVQSFVHLLCVLVDNSVNEEAIVDTALRFARQSRLSVEFLKYPPSMIAVASILCALKSLGVDMCVVAEWMHTVRECNLSYAHRPDASDLVTRCGIMLIHVDRQINGGDASHWGYDEELENLTRYTTADRPSRDWRMQATSPTDVMAVDAVVVDEENSSAVVDLSPGCAPTTCY